MPNTVWRMDRGEKNRSRGSLGGNNSMAMVQAKRNMACLCLYPTGVLAKSILTSRPISLLVRGESWARCSPRTLPALRNKTT